MVPPRRNVDISDGVLLRRLVALRRQRHLTKRELAERAQLTYRTVHDLETGRRPRVQEKTLILLAEALGIAVEDLLREGPAESSTVEPDVEAGAEEDGARTRGRLSDPTTGASPSDVADRPADRSPRRPPRHRQLRVALVAAVGLLALLLAGYHGEMRHAQWTFETDTLRARSEHLDLPLWSTSFGSKVRFCEAAPWSDAELLVGLEGDDARGRRLLALHRPTGRVLWEHRPDVERLSAAYGDSMLRGGYMRCMEFVPFDVEGDGRPEIAVVFNHGRWFPSAITVVARDGTTLSQYDHPGNVLGLAAGDVDGDGPEELFVTATMNAAAYRGATLALLDAEGLEGTVSSSRTRVERVSTDRARVRVQVPNFPDPYMERLERRRLLGQAPQILRDAKGRVTLAAEVGGGPVEQLVVELDAALRLLNLMPKDSFVVHARRAWPDSLLDGRGPLDLAWLRDWYDGRQRFERGRLVAPAPASRR